MNQPLGRRSSRGLPARGAQAGSSILGTIFLLAVAGSAVSSAYLLPFDGAGQLAASRFAVEHIPEVQASAPPELKDGEERKDDLGTQVVQSGFTTYTVHWACQQTGPIDEVKRFTQNCPPGFEFMVDVDAARRTVTVTPEALAKCPSGVGSEKVCSNGTEAAKACIASTNANLTCVVKTTAAGLDENACGATIGAGSTWNVGSAIDSNIQCRIGREADFAATPQAAETAQRGIMTAFGYDNTTQNVILNAFEEIQTTQQAVEKVDADRTSIAKRLETLAGCTSFRCAEETSMLRLDDAKLAAERESLQARLEDLRNNPQKLSAGESPSGLSNVVAGPDVPSRFDFELTENTFNGTSRGFQQEEPIVATPPLTQSPVGVIDWSKVCGRGSPSCQTALQNSATTRSVDASSGTYDQARANAAYTARLNGLAAETLYKQLQENPDAKVREDATAIVNTTKDDVGQQVRFLSTLAETAKNPILVTDEAGNLPGLGALSSIDQQELEIQGAIIETEECAQGRKSISDCFKAAGLPYTLEGRRQVASALGLDCGKIGDATANVCMFKAVQNFHQEGVLTNTSYNRVVTIDPVTGRVLSDKVEKITSTEQITAPSLAAGGTQEQIDAFKESLEKGGIVEAGDTVYRTNVDSRGVTVKCIDSTGGSIASPACNTTYAEPIEPVALQDTSLSGLLNKIEDKSAPTTKYALFDSTREYNIAALEREVENDNLLNVAVPFEKLPQSVQSQVPRSGGASAPIVDARNLAPPSFSPPSPLTSSNLEPLYDIGEVETALRNYDEKVARGETLTVAQSSIQAYDEGVARERATQAESQRLQGLANYLNQKSYIENSDATKNIYNTMVELGRTPEEASQFVKEFADDGAWENWRAGQPIQDANGNDTPGRVAANTYLSSGMDKMIDSHVRGTFESAQENAAANVTYAEELLSRSELGVQETLARAYLEDSQDRLRQIEEGYAQYQAGNPTPELQQAIDRIKQGNISGGTLSTALSNLSAGAKADAEEYGARINLEQIDGTLAYAPRWLFGETVAGVTGSAGRLLEKTGIPLFGTNAQQDLQNAIDPFGDTLQTYADIGTVIPGGYYAGKLAVSKAFPSTIRGGATPDLPSSPGGTTRIEPTLGAPPVQSPVAPFSNPSSFNIDNWTRAFESELDASRIEDAARAVTPATPPTSFTQVPPWTRVQPNDIQLPASPSTSELPPLNTSKIREIFNLSPSTPSVQTPISPAPVPSTIIRNGREVEVWRDPLTGRFTQAPVSTPAINFSSVRVVSPAPVSTPLPTLNATPLSPDAVNRLRTTFGLPALQ